MKNERHIFAVYVPTLTELLAERTVGDVFTIKDKEVWNRIFTVLRLRDESQVIFFDAVSNVQCKLGGEGAKNSVASIIQQRSCNAVLQPPIILYQGLTKKSTFEEIVYTAAQLGVTTIVPVITEKIHKVWPLEYEQTRLHNIMIAACEQSKNFTLPKIAAPLQITNLSAHVNKAYASILLDPQGELLTQYCAPLQKTAPGINLFLGAEGGITEIEHASLVGHGFMPKRLCSSILRSQDAALLALGMLRSF